MTKDYYLKKERETPKESSDYIEEAKRKISYLKRHGQIGETKAEKQKVYLEFLIKDVLKNESFASKEKEMLRNYLKDPNKTPPESRIYLAKILLEYYEISPILSFIREDATYEPQKQPTSQLF